MVRTVNVAFSATPRLKRENFARTKHDSAFSDWKILIGASDWEDYLLNKEGTERYRTHNIPNCSSCPGLYELGIVISVTQTNGKIISKLNPKNIIPVYLGQADNVRTRLQQYGRDGAHLENGWSNGEQNDRKFLRLFSDIFSYGFSIAFRWAPMESKKDAVKTESQLLETFDYAWNLDMNGERRPDDIHKRLNNTVLNHKRVLMAFKKILDFPPKEVGLRIKRCDSPVLENGSSFYTKQNDTNILVKILKFGRSRPTVVSKDCNMNSNNVGTCGVAMDHGSICRRPPVEGRKRCVDHKGMKVDTYIRPTVVSKDCNMNSNNAGTCGVALGHGSVCIRPPVEGRKRCIDHKGMKVNAYVRPTVVSKDCNVNSNNVGTCGVALGDGSICIRPPVEGRKRCVDHKGMKVNAHIRPCLELETGTVCNSQKGCEEIKHEVMTVNEKKSNISGVDSLTCAAITLNGSYCRRKPSKASKFCWQHEAVKAKIND
ncbi:hypothetical protein SSX86_021507 [Deinandra increscens subsp. villosa]|uniref:Uncharacterized protein n=1 Tax=Deinandra increscens subsp. villosa TaxID=3103831 RepID=A0AAP0CRI1_9ASTR